MMKRLFIFFLATAASFVVTWLAGWSVLHADLHVKKADATALTITPPEVLVPEPFNKTAHAANPTTTRILALDRAKHLAFWASVLRNKKLACDVVVRTIYEGGTESGVDNWKIGCRNGHQYSISVSPDTQGSVCNQNTFSRSAEIVLGQ
jgi:hypothetical protein